MPQYIFSIAVFQLSRTLCMLADICRSSGSCTQFFFLIKRNNFEDIIIVYARCSLAAGETPYLMQTE